MKNVFTRGLIGVFLVVSLLWVSPATGNVPTVYAAAPAVSIEQNNSELTRAEETEWHYRTVDGKMQRRLWSITYGKWKTDWMWV